MSIYFSNLSYWNDFSDNDYDEPNDGYSSHGDDEDSVEKEEKREKRQRPKDDRLWDAILSNDVAGVRQALQNGANVNVVSSDGFTSTPLTLACHKGYDEIVRILLDAGADAWWRNLKNQSAIDKAFEQGHFSTAEILLNHDNGLLEIENRHGHTPLLRAIGSQQSEIVHFLMDRGANVLATDEDGFTSLMNALYNEADLPIVRRLMAAGVNVDACDKFQRTAFHMAAIRGRISVMREWIVEHNANMFTVETLGRTPFDYCLASETHEFLIEIYSNKLTEVHGRLTIHAILWAAEYLFAEDDEFHSPLNPLRIHLPLGKLTLQHFRALLSTLDAELIRTRDDNGKLPIHIACQNKAPVEVLALFVEIDPATLQIADRNGALPLHDCCCGVVDNSSVICLIEQGGVSTLAARNQDGAMPLHVLCGSTNPSLRTVQYMIHSFCGSVAAQTNDGQYPFFIAASSSTASLSVVYELVRTNAVLVVARL